MKHIVITGANRGLGLEFCKQYLATGSLVTATCRLPKLATELLALKQQYSKELNIIALDITSQEMITSLAEKIALPIDVLINNAGFYGPRTAYIENLTSIEWLNVLHINSIAPILVAQELLAKIKQSKDKKIVFITSKMGSIADNSSGGSYCYRTSKAALNAAAKSLALDLKEYDISVGILHPGWVRTDMGGPNGLIDTKTSIAAMRKVIAKLNLDNSGDFFNYDGNIIPW
jgi:NAD(P)-dependent dehydrogenase (short-subunit alcohol dehydrogenase family)